MSRPYCKVKDRMRRVTAYCPKCLLGKAEMVGLVMRCKNCGHRYDPDERAFMKVRNELEGDIEGE